MPASTTEPKIGVKDAASIAMQYLQDLIPTVARNDISLEEVELEGQAWLVTLGFSGLGQAQQAITIATAPAPDSAGKKKRKVLNTIIPRDTVRIHMVGNTVDIQALTRFIRQLEQSAFIEQVQLVKSEHANDNGKDVTQFQLDMLYARPDASMGRRVPLAVSVK